MSTLQSNQVCDSSTLANFKAWAQAISTAFSTAGFVQSSDTGQVNWSSIASVPGSGAFVYEIWKSNDGLTQYYVKMEYGNWTSSGPGGGASQTNCPTIRISISTSSNGSGTLNGTYVIGPLYCNAQNYTVPSSTTQYECSFSFSGSGNRIGGLMWRNGINSCQQFFTIERSRDSSGNYTSTYVTLVVAGAIANSLDWPHAQQQSLVFGVGLSPVATRNAGSSTGFPCLAFRLCTGGNNVSSSSFNGNTAFDNIAPFLGYYDNVMTMAAVANVNDITEGVAFSVTDTLSGATMTYLPTKNISGFYYATNNNGVAPALCLRFD